MDFKTITIDELKEVIGLLNDAQDSCIENTYAKNKIKKAIEILNK